MKKIALTSLLAVFTASGAMAGNVIDGNPLYMPAKGHFYSVTDLGSSSRDVDTVVLQENFGYGITDKLAVSVGVDLIESDWFDEYVWNSLKLDAAYRVIDKGGLKLDALAGYSVGGMDYSKFGLVGLLYSHPKVPGQDSWFDKDLTMYTWTAGVRGGYTTDNFTIAGHANMIYVNTESFDWDDPDLGLHLLNFGVDTQFALNKELNLVLGADYLTSYEDYHKKGGVWYMTFGANYNIDATKYVGAYVTKEIDHTEKDTKGTWEVADGFGFGAKFGIDF